MVFDSMFIFLLYNSFSSFLVYFR